MINTFIEINWHDAILIKVEEIINERELRWYLKINISTDFQDSKFIDKIVVFNDVNKYSVNEGSMSNYSTILDAEIRHHETYDWNGYELIFETNAGKRIVYASGFFLV